MVMLNVYAFWAILELLLILAMLVAVLFWRGRRTRQALAGTSEQVKDLEQKGDISHYFTTELKLTEGHLATLGEEKKPGENLWLHLRLDYLRLEREFAADMGRDELFWPRLHKRMRPLIDAYCHLADVAATIQPEQADAQIGHLVGEQAGLLRELKSMLHQTCDDPQRLADFNQRLDRMGRISGELTVCSGMLEEENDFLRKQVASLVT